MPARFTGTTPGYIYFVRDGRYIKIGWATDPDQRLRALQAGNYRKLIIEGVIPGTLEDEEKLHDQFDECRVLGEWFKLTKDGGLWSFIRRHRKTWGVFHACRPGGGPIGPI